MEPVVIALIELVIGLLFCFSGYRFFRFLMPLWGFLLGFSVGTSGLALTTIGASNWIVGIVVGIIFALLAYTFYYAAVVLMSASVGYSLGIHFTTTTGINTGISPVILGIILAVVLAILVIAFNLPKILIIIFSALGGASAVISGIQFFLTTHVLNTPTTISINHVTNDLSIWTIAWLVLAALGLLIQWRDYNTTNTTYTSRYA
jgi:hypothetical protein